MSNPQKLWYKANWEEQGIPMCCGMSTVGGFSLISGIDGAIQYNWRTNKDEPIERSGRTGYSESARGAWDKAFTRMLGICTYNGQDGENTRYPFIINVIVGERNTEDLRAILKEKATLIHTWINPNTDNTLESYLVTNGSENNEENATNDDNDDY